MTFHEMARAAGFSGETEMLHVWYVVNGRSVNELAEYIGCSTATVTKHIRDCGIELRPRGGPNHVEQTQMIKLHYFDQRLVHLAPLKIITKLCGLSEATIRLYRRRHGKQTEG